MKIKVETLAEVILKELSGDVEYERWFGRILPFLKKISELEEKNEAFEETKKELERFKGTESINEELRRENSNLLEKQHDLETKIDILKDENKILEENNQGLQNKISKLRNIFGLLRRGITVENLYGKINQIGELLNFDLSEQIGIIKEIDENFRERQNEINTIRFDKERIEIQWVQLQKENEELRKNLSSSEDLSRYFSSEITKKNEKILKLEDEIDRLKSANEDMIE